MTLMCALKLTGCFPGFFGQDCEEVCHCKQGVCNHVTGRDCPGGCAEGFKGETCSESLTATTERMITHQVKTDSHTPGKTTTGIENSVKPVPFFQPYNNIYSVGPY